MKSLLRTHFLALAFALASVGTTQAEFIYQMSLDTTNGDNGRLVSGLFETNETVGTGLRLGDIISNYLINIEENGIMAMLTPANSSIVRDAAFFDVTETEITLSSGAGFFQGFAITNDLDNNIRYSALRTGADVNVFVSINSGSGGLNGVNRALIASIPEPSSFAMFSLVILGLTNRRKR